MVDELIAVYNGARQHLLKFQIEYRHVTHTLNTTLIRTHGVEGAIAHTRFMRTRVQELKLAHSTINFFITDDV